MPKWYEKVGSEITKIGKEVGKGAQVAAREVGKGAKVAAAEVKKTVGIGVGDIKIELATLNYNPGDVIAGTLHLTLSEPTSAKKLSVRLVGARKRVSYDKDSSGNKSQSTHTETVHDFELELDGEMTYESGEYEFELSVPKDATPAKPEIRNDGILGDVARVVTSVASANTLPTAWSVTGVLDIPWKRNVSTKIDILVATDPS